MNCATTKERSAFAIFAFSWFLMSTLIACSESRTVVSDDADAELKQGQHDAVDVVFSDLIGEYRSIATVLNLEDDEIQKIERVHSKYLAELSQWHETDGKEMRRLQALALEAARSRDRAAMRRLNASGGKEKVAAFHEAEKAIQGEYEQALLNVVPEAKLERWKSFRIATCLEQYLEPLGLTDQQKKAIHKLAPQVIRSQSQERNWQGYGTSKLEQRFESEIMTDGQKQDFERLTAKNRMRMLGWNNK